MTEMQEKVLATVKALTPPATAERVAAKIKLSPRATRVHLAALTANGKLVRSFVYVTARGSKQPVGRYVYVAASS